MSDKAAVGPGDTVGAEVVRFNGTLRAETYFSLLQQDAGAIVAV